MNTYTFTTDDPNLYNRIMQMALQPANSGPGGALVGAAVAPQTAPAAPTVPAPPPVMQAPPPAAPPVVQAPPPAVAHGPAPEGWTIDHIKSAAQTLANNPAKGGPAALKALLTEFGATSLSGIDPARWPEFYQRASA